MRRFLLLPHLSELLGTSEVIGYMAAFSLMSYNALIWRPWPLNILCHAHIRYKSHICRRLCSMKLNEILLGIEWDAGYRSGHFIGKKMKSNWKGHKEDPQEWQEEQDVYLMAGDRLQQNLACCTQQNKSWKGRGTLPVIHQRNKSPGGEKLLS